MSIIGKNGVLSVGGELLAVMPVERNITTGGHLEASTDEILCRVLKSYDIDNRFNHFVPTLKISGCGLAFGKASTSEGKRESNIENVIFNAPVTIVYWTDGTKTVVKCQPGDTYSEELGLAMAISKKFLGNKGNFNDEFKKWLPEKTEATDPHNVSVSTKRQKLEKYCEFNMCQRCALEDEDHKVCDFDLMDDAEICRLYDKVFRQKN